jgi:hypothetical protein
LASVQFQFELAFKDEEEALRGGSAKFATGFEFGRVLGESSASGGASVHDGHAGFHAGQRGSNEGVRCQKEVVVFLGAARLTKIMHGTSFFVVRRNLQAD